MPRYKRTYDEAELDIPLDAEPQPPEHIETLTKLRNMWEFASLMQYIFLFGHVVKIDDDFDIEDLESECLKPQPSEKLARIGLSLLKFVSSHRGLTLDIFDEYARRQYVAKAPLRNPYGEEEEPAKFNEFDIYTKIRVLQQLSTWTLGNASRIREAMPQDEDNLNWRMEPLGWDKEDRAYFVLDDNRLYRRTDEPPTPPTPKLKPKTKAPKKSRTKGTRASKRRKIEETSEEEAEEADVEAGAQDDTVMTNGDHAQPEEEPGFGFTNKTWECVAITLDEYQDFLATIFRSRDPNEKQLRRRIEEDVLPIIEKRAEALRQKQLRKIRELENLQKLATAKRSGRLAEKAERDKQDREEREAEEKRQADLRMAHEEQERQRRIEEGHESRRLTREQRVKEREVKRILHEEELAKIEEAANRASSQDPASDSAAEASKRMSERQLKTQKAQHKKELEKLAEEEDKWYFDCAICGMHGENLDDGSHSIACERCNVWQHSQCHGFSPKQAEKDGFHFVCSTCKRKEADAKKPKIAPLKLSKNRQSASPETQRSGSRPSTANGANKLPEHVQRQLDGVHIYQPPPHQRPGPFGQIVNGPNLPPFGHAQGSPSYQYPRVGNFAPHPQHVQPPQQPWHGSPLSPPQRPGSSGSASSPPPHMANGFGPPHQQHQQQHQNMHQNAVAAAGGHPGYHQQYQHQAQPNGYSPRAPAGMYPLTQPPPQQQQYYQHSNPYYSPQQPPQRPVAGYMPNGSQSVKHSAKPPSSSPPQQRPPYGQSPHPPQQRLAPSPSANFPPPQRAIYPQQGAHSPMKSSPSPATQYQPTPHQQQPPHLTPTPRAPEQFRPPSANGLPPNYQTPSHQQLHPSPASANANGVAADGMSGPWPAGSKAIPQKHDRSPAPAPPPTHSPLTTATQAPQPAMQRRMSSQGTQTNVVPPVELSPSQQMQDQVQVTGPASVPVKKMPTQSPMAQQSVMNDSNGLGISTPAAGPTVQTGPEVWRVASSETRSEINGTPVQSTEMKQSTAPPAEAQT